MTEKLKDKIFTVSMILLIVFLFSLLIFIWSGQECKMVLIKGKIESVYYQPSSFRTGESWSGLLRKDDGTLEEFYSNKIVQPGMNFEYDKEVCIY